MFRWLINLFPQKCQHLRVRELMSCNAVCRDCGKNLGFIQTWRDTTGELPGASEISNDPNDPASWGR